MIKAFDRGDGKIRGPDPDNKSFPDRIDALDAIRAAGYTYDDYTGWSRPLKGTSIRHAIVEFVNNKWLVVTFPGIKP